MILGVKYCQKRVRENPALIIGNYSLNGGPVCFDVSRIIMKI